MLKFEELLHIVSLHLEHCFLLVVVYFEKLIHSLFHLFLEINIVAGCGTQRNSQINGKDNIHDIHLFDHHSVNLEFFFQLFFQLGCHFSLYVSNSNDSFITDEVSNAFFTFLLKKLFQSVWSEVVEKFNNILLLILFSTILTTNMEIDSHIK